MAERPGQSKGRTCLPGPATRENVAAMTATPPLAEAAPARPPIRWPEVSIGVALNLVPIAGVLFWNWSPFALIFLYWLENVVIGVRTLLSMLAAGMLQNVVKAVGAIGLGAFFTFHYGMFCFVHGMFVLLMFGGMTEAMQADNAFDLAGVAHTLFAQQTNLAIGFAAIVLWQAVILVLFVARGEAKTASLSELMGSPYGRIMILHFTIIIGGMILMALRWPIAGVVMLALFKMFTDIAPALCIKPRGKKAPATT